MKTKCIKCGNTIYGIDKDNYICDRCVEEKLIKDIVNDNINYMDYLKQLKSQLEGIAGNWNGDESGKGEERTDAAVEGISAVNTLLLILEELNIK